MVGKHMALIIEPLGAVTQVVDLPPKAAHGAVASAVRFGCLYGILASIIKAPG